jgi:hypothetical protein
MKISMSSDLGMHMDVVSNSASLIGEQLETFFEDRSYSDGILRVGIILNCRPSYLNFKARKRFEKATKTLYYDVMLNYELIIEMPDTEKNKAVHDALQNSVEFVMGYKKKIKEFNFEEFKKDWEKFFLEFEG